MPATGYRRVALWVSAFGLIAAFGLPWYALNDSLFDLGWVTAQWRDAASAPLLWQATSFGKPWLWLALAPMLAAPLAAPLPRHRQGLAFVLVGGLGLVGLLAQAFAVGIQGWSMPWLGQWFGPIDGRQFGIGLGAVVVALALLWLMTTGLAAQGRFRGDPFTAGACGLVVLATVLFTFWPITAFMADAMADPSGWRFSALADRVLADKIWSLRCLAGPQRCGVAWNTLVLAIATGVGSTALGLAFALVVTRTAIPFKRVLRALTVLPIITPPFVIGLGLILIFGRAGLVNQLLDWAFQVPPTRWIYGFTGVLLAQLFAFTPIAFLVLIGVVEGVNATLEEAAQTLRAGPAKIFSTIALPLMKPGLVNAFLVGFIESIADFGNPIVLGGDFGVLSTEIFFAIVGAQHDVGRAAALALILLAFALAAFFAQRAVLGRKSYVAVGGKGHAGRAASLPTGIRLLALGATIPWGLMTVVVYALAMIGGFAKIWGRDYTPTLAHYLKAFALQIDGGAVQWTGAAWGSLGTTMLLAGIAAPITAAIGLTIAWLIDRQPFGGKRAFEFMTLLSFAIPGTVIGVAYVVAFNLPPIEITGTAIILVLCFVFRNLPVGVRAGIAAMTQIDKSLDEASRMLGAGGFATLRRVLLPLLRPAIAGALVYAFVRAVTTVSAVIFLVSAEYDMATTFIVMRVVNGDYGLAIAYSSVLIVLMLLVIALIDILVGRRADLSRLSSQRA